MSTLQQLRPVGARIAFFLRAILSGATRGAEALTCVASVLLAVSACDNPPTAPTVAEKTEVASQGVPSAGPLSSEGPVPGPRSLLSPEAGPLSLGFPQIERGNVDVATIANATTLPGWTENAQQFAPVGGTTASTVATAMRLLWQNTSTGDRSIWIMNGASWDGSSYALLPTVSTTWTMQASADFNGDGNADIVWQNNVTGDRSIWLMSDTTWGGSFALLPNVALAWSIAGAGDFNADGKPDLVWQNTTTGDRSIWFMNGTTWDGTFALLPNVSPAWRIAAVADFNADSKPDLVWENIATGQRSIWFMNGSTWTGSFALLLTVAIDWRIVGAADFNGDNKSDLVWQNISTGQRSIWIMNGATWDGTFALLPTIATTWSIAGTLALPVPPAPPARISLGPRPTIVDSGATLATTVIAYDSAGNPVVPPALDYVSRNPAVATVSHGGVVSGIAKGQTILVATSTSTPSIADSVWVVVTGAGQPAVYTDIQRFVYGVNETFTVKVFIDMRNSGKGLGSAALVVNWAPPPQTNPNNFLLAFQSWTNGVGDYQAEKTNSVAAGFFFFDMVNAEGIPGKVEVFEMTFRTGPTAGTSGGLLFNAVELNADDFTVTQGAQIGYHIMIQ